VQGRQRQAVDDARIVSVVYVAGALSPLWSVAPQPAAPQGEARRGRRASGSGAAGGTAKRRP
jgi:hypothetical protein